MGVEGMEKNRRGRVVASFLVLLLLLGVWPQSALAAGYSFGVEYKDTLKQSPPVVQRYLFTAPGKGLVTVKFTSYGSSNSEGVSAPHGFVVGVQDGSGKTLLQRYCEPKSSITLPAQEVPAGGFYLGVMGMRDSIAYNTSEYGFSVSFQATAPEGGQPGGGRVEVKLPAKLFVEKGKTLKLPVVAQPASLKSDIRWVASGKAAKVTGGKVKGLKKGTAKIQATSKATGAVYASCTVVVLDKKVALEGISCKKTASVKKGKTVQLKPKAKPANATGLVWKYSSSKKKVAKVDALGRVTGISKGTATITLRCGSYKAAVRVTVK